MYTLLITRDVVFLFIYLFICVIGPVVRAGA